MRVIHFPSFPFCLVYFWIRQTRNKRKNKTIVHFSVVAFLLFCFSYRLFFCVLRRPALPTLYFCTYTSIEQWCYMHLTLAVWLAFIARCSQSKCIFFSLCRCSGPSALLHRQNLHPITNSLNVFVLVSLDFVFNSSAFSVFPFGQVNIFSLTNTKITSFYYR